MKLSPHLGFSGQCEAAFHFYERCLGGKIVTMITYGDSPLAEQVPPEWRGKIMHATLTFGANALAGADILPEKYESPKGFQLLLSLDDPVEAERIFQSLAEDGKVQMPLQQTFWALRFGVLTDRFGFVWEINCEAAQPNPV
jgi:PhnB protein